MKIHAALIGGALRTSVQEFSRPAPRNGRLDHCTFHHVGENEIGSFELVGETSITFTPPT